MNDRSSRSTRVAELDALRIGSYVELEGVLRARAPVVGPVSGRPLVGYHVLCSIFGDGDEFAGRRDVIRWSETVLEDETGEVRVALSGSEIRVPATREETLEDRAAIRSMLAKLELEHEAARELQLLERGIGQDARVSVRGVIARLDTPGGAFRVSARPPLAVAGERGRPLVVTPR